MKKHYRLTGEELEAMILERVEEVRRQYAMDHERDLLMRQADMRALQSQINPHFLYNALESIRGQAITENCPQIALMTQTLAKFFRYSISTKGNIVTVRDELDNVDNYMRIQQYRFGSRFSYKVELIEPAEQAEKAAIPKLTLQPLVENAIVHGFSNMTEGGRVRIRVEPLIKNVCITISDNGCGIADETLRSLIERLSGKNPAGSDIKEHVGIANVDRRLKLCFGPEYGLEINSEQGSGTTVEFLIPLQGGPETA